MLMRVTNMERSKASPWDSFFIRNINIYAVKPSFKKYNSVVIRSLILCISTQKISPIIVNAGSIAA